MQEESPFNAVAPIVVALAAFVALIELAFSMGAAGLVGGPAAVGWRVSSIEAYGFSPAVWDQVMQRGNWSADMLRRFVTYTFVHGSITQTLFGAALLLALGKFVGDVFNTFAVLALYVLTSIIGAFVYGWVVQENYPLYGVYTPVYGFIGAFTYLMWLRLGQLGENQLMAFRLIGFLMAIQLVFGVLFGGSPIWIAEVAGFVAGFALSVLLAPGGWSRFLDRIRQR